MIAAGLVGLAFAGSPDRIAEGVRIAGVDVGGLTKGEAIARLEARSRAVANVPVVFTANGRRWRASPNDLGVQAQWKAAVERAQSEGEGFAPWRGLRRVSIRLMGSDVTPPAHVWKRALDYKVARMSAAVGTRHRDAAIVLRGLRPQILPGRTGLALDKQLASQAIVGALIGFERGQVVKLPVAVDSPKVTAAELAPVADQVRTALSGTAADEPRGLVLVADARPARVASVAAPRRLRRAHDRRQRRERLLPSASATASGGLRATRASASRRAAASASSPRAWAA